MQVVGGPSLEIKRQPAVVAKKTTDPVQADEFVASEAPPVLKKILELRSVFATPHQALAVNALELEASRGQALVDADNKVSTNYTCIDVLNRAGAALSTLSQVMAQGRLKVLQDFTLRLAAPGLSGSFVSRVQQCSGELSKLAPADPEMGPGQNAERFLNAAKLAEDLTTRQLNQAVQKHFFENADRMPDLAAVIPPRPLLRGELTAKKVENLADWMGKQSANLQAENNAAASQRADVDQAWLLVDEHREQHRWDPQTLPERLAKAQQILAELDTAQQAQPNFVRDLLKNEQYPAVPNNFADFVDYSLSNYRHSKRKEPSPQVPLACLDLLEKTSGVA